jgi:hypothetical protein
MRVVEKIFWFCVQLAIGILLVYGMVWGATYLFAPAFVSALRARGILP